MGGFVHRRARKRAGKVAKANPRLPHLWRGIDLQRELRRLLRFCPDALRENPPHLVLTPCSRAPKSGNIAFADFNTHEIEIRLWPSCPAAWALGSLLHELAHFCRDHAEHSEGWRQAMLELLRDGYGVTPDFPVDRTYLALDQAVEDALHLWVMQRFDVDAAFERALDAWAKRQVARDKKRRTRACKA